eukprot:9424075-Karenia_brevis.AAC.1
MIDFKRRFSLKNEPAFEIDHVGTMLSQDMMMTGVEHARMIDVVCSTNAPRPTLRRHAETCPSAAY